MADDFRKNNMALAKQHKVENSAYRLELRKGRTLAVRFCNKLIQEALDGNEASREALNAVSEIIKESREVLVKNKNRKHYPGKHSKDDIDEAMKAMEDV